MRTSWVLRWRPALNTRWLHPKLVVSLAYTYFFVGGYPSTWVKLENFDPV